MDAGREMDALVASRVFGDEVRTMGLYQHPDCGDWDTCFACAFPGEKDAEHHHVDEGPCYLNEAEMWRPVAEYSSDIRAAWQVVEHLIAKGPSADIADFHLEHDVAGWSATFDCTQTEWEEGHHTTPALAICRAALAAVGVEA